MRSECELIHPFSSSNIPAGSVLDPPIVDLTLVIPAYNETKRIGVMLTETLAYLDSLQSCSYEILVVDDGSRDDTVPNVIALFIYNSTSS